MRIPFQLSVLASAVVLAGCGGGGGPGSGSNVRPSTNSWTHVGTVDPSVNVTTQPLEFNSFTADITGDGTSDVIFSGRETAPGITPTGSESNTKIHLFAWESGTLVDRTSTWFEAGENEIMGTEPSVQFTDFFNSGRTDMFVAHGTDMQTYGPSYVYRNTGSKFERIIIPMNNVWSHGSEVADVNGDTYDDILILDYGPNTTLAINNTVDNFTTYVDYRGTSGDLRYGGSDVAIADFNGDGEVEFIITDNGCNAVACNSVAGTTRMYSYDITGGNLSFNYENNLPLPYLDRPEYFDSVEDHQVRIEAHDFNEDGVQDVIVFGRNLHLQKISTVQFLQNDGAGNFTDVTDDVLIGYDKDTHSTYRPIFTDINNDGKIDILISGGDWTGNNNSHQILIKSADNKYIAAYQNVLTDILNEIETDMGYNSGGNTVNIIEANGKKYLVTWYQWQDINDRKLNIYLREFTASGLGTTAENAVDLLQTTWSYLSDSQAQEALTSTALSLNGGYVIDLERAMQPLGDLQINNVTLSGSLSAPGINTNIFNGVVATDSIGRGYNVDLSVRSSTDTNIGSFNQHYAPQKSLTSSLVANSDYDTYAIGNNNNFTAAYTGTNTGWNYTVSHTIMDGYSPWLNITGVFGEIKSSSTTELALHNRYDNGSWLQFGYTVSQTDINPGLVVSADPIHAFYTVIGHRFDGALNGLEVMTGVEPHILAGKLGVNIPEGVDTSGNLMYNYNTIELRNKFKQFTRFNYTYEMNYNARIKLEGALEQGGPTSTRISLEMPL